MVASSTLEPLASLRVLTQAAQAIDAPVRVEATGEPRGAIDASTRAHDPRRLNVDELFDDAGRVARRGRAARFELVAERQPGACLRSRSSRRCRSARCRAAIDTASASAGIDCRCLALKSRRRSRSRSIGRAAANRPRRHPRVLRVAHRPPIAKRSGRPCRSGFAARVDTHADGKRAAGFGDAPTAPGSRPGGRRDWAERQYASIGGLGR